MKKLLLLALLPLSLAAQTPYDPITVADLADLSYTESLYPDQADHDPAVPEPGEFLGFPVGQRTATSAEIDAYARRLAEASERVELIDYGQTFEGRALVYLVVSSPDNLARSEAIQDGMARLADPRGLVSGQRDRLINDLPAVAWLAYSIHGNESSGSDAALAVMYHLAADRSEATTRLLDELVVIVDPNMNPDGRERFMNALDQHRGRHPNIDDQSLLHAGYWPYGRGNHYLFDLNRDWIYARHPETRSRIPHVTRWRPMLFVDAHEMGAQDSYLFSPAREPHNPHLPPYRQSMGEVFADDQAEAFDRFGYPYYSGEWHEDWYPGYTDAWASLRGAQGILYEQARLAEDGVQRRTHRISYLQSVHHQVLSSFANLETLRRERSNMLEQFASDRARVVSADGPYAERSFVILPTPNRGRVNDLLDLAHIQDFEVHRLTREVRVARAVDQLGRELSNRTLPVGSLVLRNRQPEARLLAAMFEFDPQISDSALTAERQRILREGRSTIYDTTGWNISMMFGLEALTVPEHLEAHLEPVEAGEPRTAPPAPTMDESTIALVVSGADDRANALAGRLLQQGVSVRAARSSSALDGVDLPVGSIAVTLDDNRASQDWAERVQRAAADLGLAVHAVGHGRAPGALADLGGREWRVLERPNVALIGRGSTNMLDFGAVWYLLDHRLGLRHSHLDEDRAAAMDLRRYNVIYLPERWGWGGGALPAALVSRLEDWVRAGGTLIAAGNAARGLIAGDEPWVQVRSLDQIIEEDLGPYQDALYREWLAGKDPVPPATWAHEAATPTYPWADTPALPSGDERKRRDQWQALFMPSGALVAARADDRHWLNAGGHDVLTVLFSNSPILMARPPVEAPLRIGVYSDAEGEAGLVGWAAVPENQELRVRSGGLLWPEARERIASSAWVTRESVGRGQVILFAHAPAFRAAQLGAMRVLENAIILGPGMGASAPIELP